MVLVALAGLRHLLKPILVSIESLVVLELWMRDSALAYSVQFWRCRASASSGLELSLMVSDRSETFSLLLEARVLPRPPQAVQVLPLAWTRDSSQDPYQGPFASFSY
jgi:hypothetical protein